MSNSEISRLFSLYAELLRVHQQDERLSELLSEAAYRLLRLDTGVIEMQSTALKNYFVRRLWICLKR